MRALLRPHSTGQREDGQKSPVFELDVSEGGVRGCKNSWKIKVGNSQNRGNHVGG